MEITSNDGIKVSGDAMKYTFDNEAYLESNDRHIPDVGTVKSMINDTIPDVSGFVEYADSNDVFVTPAQLGDSLAAFSGGDNLGSHTATDSLDMSGFRIYNLDEPVASDDAATKNYVDENAVTGLQAAIDKEEELDGPGYFYVEFLSNNFLEDDGGGLTFGGGDFSFRNENDDMSFQIRNDGLFISDDRTIKKGLEYVENISSYLKANARSIPDVGTVAEIIADSLAAFSGGDDLGSHTATLDLDLDGNSLLNADTITLTDATGDLASIVPGSLNADRTYTLINRSGELALRTIEVETYNTSATHVIKSTNDYIRVDGSAGAQTYTLPTATEGRVLIFKRIDNNPATTITFTGTVDGAVNPISTTGGSPIEVLATQYGFTTLVGNGTSWEKIN